MDWAAVLANAGGWTVVVAMIGLIGIGVVKRWWVPGFVYQREVERGDRATTTLEAIAPLIKEFTDVLRSRKREE